MSISSIFIRRPVATSLVMAAIFLSGAVAFPLLPVASLPEVDFPTIVINANLPGASPATMAATVAQPLETQFSQIADVSEMTSTSSVGAASITLQFNLDRNIDAAAGDVQAAINAASGQLPTTLPSAPTYRKVNPADSPILILGLHSDTLPLTSVDDVAETVLSQKISQIKGVSQVSIGGQQKPAVRIEADPARLAAMGLSLEDVRGGLESASVNAPKGSIDGPRRSFSIYDNDQITQAADYQNTIVAWRNGAPVRVRDIGRAINGAENDETAGWDGNHRAIILLVFKQAGANVISTVDSVRKLLPILQSSISPAIKIDVVADRTQTIRASVAEVESTLLLTVALVVMVIFLFLRSLWATIIPGVAVPLAITGTFVAMYLMGYSLDNLSLMALTISVGFVVDDAIVMLENIYRHMENGMDPREAALQGAGEIGFTIVSISLSLIAVFIPLLLMGGIVGRLFREFAVTVTFAVVISAVVSLTLTPMMCSMFLRHETKHGPVYRAVERMFDAVQGFYRRTLDIALRFRFITLMVFLATMATSVALFVIIPKGFFPEQDTGLIMGTTDATQDISFTEMAKRQQAVTAIIGADPDVAGYISFIGSGAMNQGRVIVALKPFSERTTKVKQVIARLRPKLAAVEGDTLYMQPAQDVRVGGRPTRTLYQFTLQDADSDQLYSWSAKVLAAMRKLPALRDVATDQELAGAAATLTIDRAKTSALGITVQQIDDVLYDAFGQRQVAQFATEINTYHVILTVPGAEAGDLSTLNKLYVHASNGSAVPLSSVLTLESHGAEPLVANHQSQFPAVTISFNLAQGAALGDAVNQVDAAMRKLGTPLALQGSFQGTAEAFQSSLSTQPYLIAAALIAVYIILGILYESFILPLTILSTLPSAGVGALLMLMAAGQDLSVIAIIGVILLIGIVKKNGIMMVDFAITAERVGGLSPEEAIRQACALRFRPILMTTMAALLAGLPLMLRHGAGSELRQPLGYAMVGGLALSQILTLYTTPVVYLYLDRLRRMMTGEKAARLPSLAAQMGHAAD